MVRTVSVDENGLRKGAWTQEEDDKLRAFIVKYGYMNWRQLPKFAGLSRCGKSCRLRWINYLRPGVKHGNFSREEEDLIIQLHQELGNKWSRIAMKLPGRTDNEIKNHWHTRLKKQLLNQSQMPTEQVKEEPVKNESSDTSINPLPPSILESSSFDKESCQFPVAQDTHSHVSVDTIFEETIGEDFWTQPFLEDSIYKQDFYGSSYSLLCDDNMDDFINQVMYELPDNM